MGKHRNIQIGDVFYNLKVVENLGLKEYFGKKATYYRCECLKCGNIIDVPRPYLGKSVKDCGCGKAEPRRKIKPGEKYGHLTVTGQGKYQKGRGYWYLCECDCEKHTRIEVRGDMLRSGEVTSCGCVHDAIFQKNRKKAYEKIFVKKTNIPRLVFDKPQRNNTSGVTGVSWHRGMSKWVARISFQGKTYHLGYYDNIKTAEEVRKAAENEIHRNFWKWYSDNFPKEYRRITENRTTKNLSRQESFEKGKNC